MKKDLPLLKIIPQEKIIFHEEFDPRRVKKLIQRIKRDGILKNPPIVASLKNKKYVLLDGANRVNALRQLKCRDILVQIVNYYDPKLQLDSWFHLLSGNLGRNYLSEQIENIPGLKIKKMSFAQAEKRLAKRKIICYILLGNQGVFGVVNDKNFKSQIALLNKIVSIYKGKVDIYRVKTNQIAKLAKTYKKIIALVVFPKYTPKEIMALAMSNLKLPTGITRHVIPERALRINLPIGFFRSDLSLTQKNKYFKKIIKDRLLNKQIRFYPEPTYIYDE